MEKTVILQKSKRKGKRYKVTMKGFPNMTDHSHDFGSDVGKTYIDGATDKQKKAWIARHSKDKGYDNIHSGIFYSKKLLWNTPSLKKNIDLLSNELNSKFIVKFKL